MCILVKKRLCMKSVGVRFICLQKERMQVNATWLNISPNRKIYRKEVEKSTLVRFSLCECFNCELILQLTK